MGVIWKCYALYQLPGLASKLGIRRRRVRIQRCYEAQSPKCRTDFKKQASKLWGSDGLKVLHGKGLQRVYSLRVANTSLGFKQHFILPELFQTYSSPPNLASELQQDCPAPQCSIYLGVPQNSPPQSAASSAAGLPHSRLLPRRRLSGTGTYNRPEARPSGKGPDPELQPRLCRGVRGGPPPALGAVSTLTQSLGAVFSHFWVGG